MTNPSTYTASHSMDDRTVDTGAARRAADAQVGMRNVPCPDCGKPMADGGACGYYRTNPPCQEISMRQAKAYVTTRSIPAICAATKPSALDTQVGGDHYKTLKIQPMEYSMANKLDACQHTAIKYITRFRAKGGIADLEKAKHCIDMLIEFERMASNSAVSGSDQRQQPQAQHDAAPTRKEP